MVVFVGHKRDSWFAIDSLTGTKVQTLSVNSAPEVCLSSGVNQVFIGRTGIPVTHLLYGGYIMTLEISSKIVFDSHIPFYLEMSKDIFCQCQTFLVVVHRLHSV